MLCNQRTEPDYFSSGPVGETGLGQKAEARSRSVHICNLPPATQEGLLQQVLEKHTRVKRVEVFQDRNEAVVEFETTAVSHMRLLSWSPTTDYHTGGWKAVTSE